MDLHLPRKSGNLDCTFCLDCVRACPHDNIGIWRSRRAWISFETRAVIRGPALPAIGYRSLGAGVRIRRIRERRVHDRSGGWLPDHLAAQLGLGSRTPVTSVLLFIALVAVPAVLAFFAAYASRAVSRISVTARELFCRFSLSLVPLGVAMWAAHFLFHLAVGWDSGWTTIRRAANDVGWHLLKSPSKEIASPLLGADAVRVLQTVLLDAGFLLALYLLWRIRNWLCAPLARRLSPVRAVGRGRHGPLRRWRLDCSSSDGNARVARLGLTVMKCIRYFFGGFRHWAIRR